MTKKIVNVCRKTIACILAFFTAATMNDSIFVTPDTVQAAGSSTLARVSVFSYTDGSAQTYTAPATGTYILEVTGASGGDSGEFLHGVNYKGGNGGYVKCSVQLNAGDTLYIYVGKRGDSLGDTNYSPANTNGAGSGGGGAFGARSGAGGGASEIRINGISESNRLVVAGGGGGGAQDSNGGAAGGNGGAAGSGNANTISGVTACAVGGGGGGGYRGGVCGTTSASSVGGSNFAHGNCQVSFNGTNPEYAGGSVKITQCTNSVLVVDPNSGVWEGSNQIQTFTFDPRYDTSADFGYTGGVQTYVVPYTGYYYIEACGASGGSDASRGGYGGYVQAYTYLEQGNILSIVVGGSGWQQDGESYDHAHPGGYNGGAGAGQTGNSSSYSGTGGGATHIAFGNRNIEGNNPITGYAANTNEVIVVAGGGAGGSAASSGEGGSVLYTGSSYPGTVHNGASTDLLNNVFGVGSNPGETDGGGGGGGWIGGVSGYDAEGHSAGGGASFINTSPTYVQNMSGQLVTSSLSIPISLTPDTWAGDGHARIRYMSDTVLISDPVREGYTFTGWTFSGPGELTRTNLGAHLFKYEEGRSTLVANWVRNQGVSELMIDPNGGVFDGSEHTSVRIGTNGQTAYIGQASRFGYRFVRWEYSLISGSGDSWSEPTYRFGYGTTAKLTAVWIPAQTSLTIDPKEGTYEGQGSKKLVQNLRAGSTTQIDIPVKLPGYLFDYWTEDYGSDGYLASDGWHAGTRDGYLSAHYRPITYKIHYEPNAPAGLSVSGTQPDQVHTYDQTKAVAANQEYNDPNGFSIPGVKFLWWNTKPDGTGTTYMSGQDVRNLTDRQDDVITLYAQWMIKYTVEHYKENLDGSYTLADTDEYRLIPLTTWTAPLHNYPGWSQPESKPFVVGTQDTTIKLYYPLIHYKLTYDTQGGEWYEEQPDGTWISILAPPSEYTVLTPDIHVAKPDRVGYTFLGWTGTDVPNKTVDVVIPKGSLGDRAFTAHWEAQAYDIDVPVSVLFSVGYDGSASGVIDQNGDGNHSHYGYINNNSLFPVQVTNVTFDNESDFVFTHDRTLDQSHKNLMDWRLDIQNSGGEWNQYAPELLGGVVTGNSDIFWMAQNGVGRIKMNVDNAWAIHEYHDIKAPMELGHIVWTFGIGHRNVVSRTMATAEME